jgi:hypothetical protein
MSWTKTTSEACGCCQAWRGSTAAWAQLASQAPPQWTAEAAPPATRARPGGLQQSPFAAHLKPMKARMADPRNPHVWKAVASLLALPATQPAAPAQVLPALNPHCLLFLAAVRGGPAAAVVHREGATQAAASPLPAPPGAPPEGEELPQEEAPLLTPQAQARMLVLRVPPVLARQATSLRSSALVSSTDWTGAPAGCWWWPRPSAATTTCVSSSRTGRWVGGGC